MISLQEAIKEEKNFVEKCYKSANFHHTNENVHMENVCRELAEYYEQIIKWLEELQELKKDIKEDCISRQEVLDQTYLWSKDEFLRTTNPFYYLRKRINSLQPITSAQKWIPCSEQLPKESGKYLVTFGGIHLIGVDFYTTEEDARRDFEEYYEEYTGWSSGSVVAWMPLPEPYKESEEE